MVGREIINLKRTFMPGLNPHESQKRALSTPPSDDRDTEFTRAVRRKLVANNFFQAINNDLAPNDRLSPLSPTPTPTSTSTPVSQGEITCDFKFF